MVIFRKEDFMQEQFEKWYCDNYWNFKAVKNRQVFFDIEKGRYNHLDVDLAYNAFVAGGRFAAEVAAPEGSQFCVYCLGMMEAIKKAFGVEI
jgi:hypothetical protein